MDAPKLLVQGVTKIFRTGRQRLDVLASIDLAVAAGEFVSLIGPSGCGKSTLFNIIAGVEQPTSGIIAIDDDAEHVRTGKPGYIPHQPLLLPWITVAENSIFCLHFRHFL